MGKTGIEWTDVTWNPVRGCSRVSEGCRNCYAEHQAARIVRMGNGKQTPYDGLVKLVTRDQRQIKIVNGEATGEFRTVQVAEPRWTGKVILDPRKLAEPLRWRAKRRVFVNSMSDLFHESLSNEQIAAVFGVMAACPQHTFQVLTKRARRMREWFAWLEREAAKAGPGAEVELCVNCADEHEAIRDIVIAPPWPLRNVWIGVSVENQAAADERIPELLRAPAVVRFLSCEPLLGPVALQGDDPPPAMRSRAYLRGITGDERINWVIAGCESGPGARPAEVAWFRSLRDQCAEASAPFFLKQAEEIPRPQSHSGKREPLFRLDAVDLLAFSAGPGSHRKGRNLIGAPYLDGMQHVAFPEQP